LQDEFFLGSGFFEQGAMKLNDRQRIVGNPNDTQRAINGGGVGVEIIFLDEIIVVRKNESDTWS
jgi:hypothetical protein